MTVWKAAAVGILVGGALTGSAWADAMSWVGGGWGQSKVSIYGQGVGAANPTPNVVSNSPGTTTTGSASPQIISAVQAGGPAAGNPAFASSATTLTNAPYGPPGGTGGASPVDAFVNLGSGPYPEQNQITTGNTQPWYNSSLIGNFFGGQPSLQQQQGFSDAVIQRVEQTFQQSGVPITLTDNPNVPAAHTLSVVSNTSSLTFPGAIGTTNIGANGFTFIDPITKSAQTLDQLEWIVAHNVSHELMLAFGVPEKYDQTGNYIDSTNANWSMMTSPSATFSPAAAQALLAQMGLTNPNSAYQPGAQMLDPPPVPEPGTMAIWVAALSAITVGWRKKAFAK
jgi:hypothetical protein